MAKRPKIFRAAYLPKAETVRKESQRRYERRRGSASERGYSHKWSRAADGHRRRNPLCVGCHALGRAVPAELVDHVEPHKGDWGKFWNKDMWQSSCRWHHDVIKQRLEVMWLAKKIPTSELWLNSSTAIELAQSL